MQACFLSPWVQLMEEIPMEPIHEAHYRHEMDCAHGEWKQACSVAPGELAPKVPTPPCVGSQLSRSVPGARQQLC